ncbi:outer membrane beta-barrel domain-containing protein [Aggregicoccus sp. 17bor-14]|uniref:outer membrane beta-barrel domain-containing protein n=1 Tax=Myxococcaceae TaxID=31 RepID=UPI00129D1113|nr:MULTISPECIES: outer membrane beta-barrel domain-containing protein [Myxococcaceae]MBF5044933.1 outer membrane beta-barrel domain-containing protein [Simulacricoccus sp. 17bor-14]MRI90676.1 outer membrane beta-barrel domain-containing protein [Aggregicoccus sp. 17bor-14]
MNRPLITLLALCLLSAPALAQNDPGMGLDLTQDAKEPAKQDEAPPAPPKDVPSVAAPAQTERSPDADREITQDDRVKSVQRKVYLKKGRFELAPFVSVSVNDPYYTKYGGALRGAYYLADSLAIAGRFSLMQSTGTDDVVSAKRTFGSRIFNSVPKWSAMGDVEWSPLYGKVAFFNSILHLDAYLLAGAGVVNTEASALPEIGVQIPAGGTVDDVAKRGPRIAGDLGVGARFVAKDFLAFNVALINTTYVDQPKGSTKGSTQNLMTLNAGVSIFFPFHSTGREAE